MCPPLPLPASTAMRARGKAGALACLRSLTAPPSFLLPSLQFISTLSCSVCACRSSLILPCSRSVGWVWVVWGVWEGLGSQG